MASFNPAYCLFDTALSTYGAAYGTTITQRGVEYSIGVTVNPSFGGCCGAAQASGWSGQWEATAVNKYGLDRIKQDFLYQLIMTMGGCTKTLYFIATDAQVKQCTKGPLALLLECGAKIVDDTPNQVHGPNKMCLCVWSPKVNAELVKKYLTVESWYEVKPNWWEALGSKGQEEYIKSPGAVSWLAAEQTAAENRKKANIRQSMSTLINQLTMWNTFSDSQKNQVIQTGKYYGVEMADIKSTKVSTDYYNPLKATY